MSMYSMFGIYFVGSNVLSFQAYNFFILRKA